MWTTHEWICHCKKDTSRRILLAYHGVGLFTLREKMSSISNSWWSYSFTSFRVAPHGHSWPFVEWEWILSDQLSPKLLMGLNSFLLQLITNWIEAITFKEVTKKAVVNIVHSNIIRRFGIPRDIITDTFIEIWWRWYASNLKLCNTILLHTDQNQTELWM